MVHFKVISLMALATLHAVSASPVGADSHPTLTVRDDAPAAGQPYYDPDSHSIEIHPRDAFAAPGEPYYDQQTNSIEINDTTSAHIKRLAPGGSPGNPGDPPFIIGHTGARIWYDTTGYVRVVATVSLSYLIQSFFQNVGNEVRNLGAALSNAVNRGNSWNADYNQNFEAQTITVGVNFNAGQDNIVGARNLANDIHAYFSQNTQFPPGGISFLMGDGAALNADRDPNAEPVDPPPAEPTGAPGQRLMARQAGVTDFCTAPAKNAFNLVIGTPDGAVTGGKANMISC